MKFQSESQQRPFFSILELDQQMLKCTCMCKGPKEGQRGRTCLLNSQSYCGAMVPDIGRCWHRDQQIDCGTEKKAERQIHTQTPLTLSSDGPQSSGNKRTHSPSTFSLKMKTGTPLLPCQPFPQSSVHSQGLISAL